MEVAFYLSDVHIGDFGDISEEVKQFLSIAIMNHSSHIFRALPCRGLSYVVMNEATIKIVMPSAHWT